MFRLLIVLLASTLCLSGCSLNVNPAFAESYPDNLWQGIMGEAVGEGYQGIYAVACVYRNRISKSMPLGCVALTRKDLPQFCHRQGQKYCQMAKEIIHKVFVENGVDVSNGATHYEAIQRYGKPYWAYKMKVTAKIGEHTFYK